ncbi:hypothetical protein BSPWISOXPB_6589 [uncultured Gammaproteobacteria bacterium]|nr:hypothetical protein BSPWISOXPB_6589 [uncultured Gammaproteobacteria bacterium]
MKAGFNKLIAHGVTGGVRSRLSGGSFKSGFLGSAVSYGASWSGAYEAAGVSSQANTWAQRAQNAVASYVVGGIAAELGGGKFANGGMSAAFSRMFNDLHVIMYEGGKGNPFGHLGSAVNSDNTRGLYLKDGSSMWGGGGEIRPDVGSKASDKVIIKTTPEQDRIYQNYLDNLDVSHDLPYHIVNNSCVDVVRTGLGVIGISVQDVWRPGKMMNELRQYAQ